MANRIKMIMVRNTVWLRNSIYLYSHLLDAIDNENRLNRVNKGTNEYHTTVFGPILFLLRTSIEICGHVKLNDH